MAKNAIFVLMLLGFSCSLPATASTPIQHNQIVVVDIPESVLNEIFCDVAECWPTTVQELWNSYRNGLLNVEQVSKGEYEVSSVKYGGTITLVLLDDAA